MSFTVQIHRPTEGQLDMKVDFKPDETWTADDLSAAARRMRALVPTAYDWHWLYERTPLGVVITVKLTDGTTIESAPLNIRENVAPTDAPARWMDAPKGSDE